MKKLSVKMLATTGIMSALSAILYIFVKFPLPSLFPAFLDIQVSEIPALITGYMYGPVAGSIVILIRCLVKLPMSTSGFVGELGDLIIGLCLVIPSSLIYKKWHTLKGAIYGFIACVLLATGMAMLCNKFVLIPLYLKLYFNGDLSILVGALSVIPGVSETNYMIKYLLYAVLPFNLLRYAIVGVITFLIYKRIHIFINRIGNHHTPQHIEEE